MNNEMLPTLFDSELPQEQTVFDYESIPNNVLQGIVLQKTAEIQWLLKRSTTDIIKIGQNLLDIKNNLPHGMFLQWIQSEFEMSDRSARDFMNIARRFGDKSATVADLSRLEMKVIRELASPSTPDEIIDQVIVGDLPPTKEAIKQAKQEARMAKQEAARMKG